MKEKLQIKFGKWNKEKYFWSDKQIQNLYSTVCGYYCIAFLIYMNNRPRLSEFQKFLDMFSDDPKKNRTILAEFLKPY